MVLEHCSPLVLFLFQLISAEQTNLTKGRVYLCCPPRVKIESEDRLYTTLKFSPTYLLSKAAPVFIKILVGFLSSSQKNQNHSVNASHTSSEKVLREIDYKFFPLEILFCREILATNIFNHPLFE